LELNFLKNIIKELKKWFGKIEFFNILLIVTILYPLFKNVHVKDPVACQKVITKVIKLVINSIQETNSTNYSSMVEKQ